MNFKKNPVKIRRIPISLAEAISLVNKKTRAWAVEHNLDRVETEETDTPVISPTVKALVDILEDPMGIFKHEFSQKKIEALALMFSLVLKEDVPLSSIADVDCDDDIKFQLMIMVVPLAKRNSHNYPIGKPCLIIKDVDGDNDIALRKDGTLGNHLVQGCVRPATLQEIHTFFDDLPDTLEHELVFP